MPFQATIYRVLIASPGDLPMERDVVSEEIHAWNAAHSLRYKAVLLPVRWETHATPDLSGRPQEIINEQLVSNCDLLIGLFWTRLGTPTGESESGTVEEIQQFVNSGRRVLLYFSQQPVALGSVNFDQYTKLRTFRDSLQQKGLLGEFESVDEFRRKLTHDIVSAMDDIHQQPPADNVAQLAPNGLPVPPSAGSMTDDAKELLTEAVSGESHGIYILNSLGSVIISANKREFAKAVPGAPNQRAIARWEAAIKILLQLNLIESKGKGTSGTLYNVTHSGYEIAERFIMNQ